MGSAPNLDWLVNTQGIAPHVRITDKSQREDGTFSRENFIYDEARDCYVCPAGKTLTTTGHIRDGPLLAYLARVHDCRGCLLKPNCCPKTPQRKVLRSIYEPARDVARALAKTEAFAQSRRDRKKVEMLFAHLKRILRLNPLTPARPERRSIRVYVGSHRSEPAPARQACGPPAAGCIRRALCVSVTLASSNRLSRRQYAASTGALCPKAQSKWAAPPKMRLLQQNRPEAEMGRLCFDCRCCLMVFER
jgi:hypothetical protein